MLVLNSITISVHKPQRLKIGVGTEMESNSGVPVYQPSALLLGQTGSLSTCFFPWTVISLSTGPKEGI